MLKKLVLAAAGLMIAAPALADEGRWGYRDGGHGHYDRGYHNGWNHHPRFARPVVVMPPPRVYYAPPPRVYYAPPAPVYYVPPPRPVYYPAAPAPESSISIRLHFPL